MSFKSYISRALRKMHLLSFAEEVRFALQKIKYSKGNRVFKEEHREVEMPPEFYIYETYRLNYKWYYYDGKTSAEEIVTLLSKYFDLSIPRNKVLDWGCGPGRVVRHLPELLPNSEIYGTDYNEKYIQWCKKYLPGIQFSTNDINPPLNYQSSFFDMVVGLSIFTHLSKKNHLSWINELYRIIKSGGGVLITTQGKAYYSRLTSAEKLLFDSGELVTRVYLNEGNRLYSAFQPPSFINELIVGKFRVLEFMPGKILDGEPSQDCWLLCKT